MSSRGLLFAALLATGGVVGVVGVHSLGSVVAINQCSYPVYVECTPSSGGGHDPFYGTLHPGQRFSQRYTSLSNGNGWSVKLAKREDLIGSTDTFQLEYTYHHANATVSWDLSAVNGDPWAGHWQVEGSGSCHPKHKAYRFSTDNHHGMQTPCSSSDSIFLTLCRQQDKAPIEPTTNGAASPSSTSTQTATAPSDTQDSGNGESLVVMLPSYLSTQVLNNSTVVCNLSSACDARDQPGVVEGSYTCAYSTPAM